MGTVWRIGLSNQAAASAIIYFPTWPGSVFQYSRELRSMVHQLSDVEFLGPVQPYNESLAKEELIRLNRDYSNSTALVTSDINAPVLNLLDRYPALIPHHLVIISSLEDLDAALTKDSFKNLWGKIHITVISHRIGDRVNFSDAEKVIHHASLIRNLELIDIPSITEEFDGAREAMLRIASDRCISRIIETNRIIAGPDPSVVPIRVSKNLLIFILLGAIYVGIGIVESRQDAVYRILALGCVTTIIHVSLLSPAKRLLSLPASLYADAGISEDVQNLATKFANRFNITELKAFVALAWYVNSKCDWRDPQFFEAYILNPEIDNSVSINWRWVLWKQLNQLVDRGASRETVAQRICLAVRARVSLIETVNPTGVIEEDWESAQASPGNMKRILIAALRSQNIAARISKQDTVEYYDGATWRCSPQLPFTP